MRNPKQSKESILTIRKQAKSMKEWCNALGIGYMTLKRYCEHYQIPFDLSTNYIEPISPITSSTNKENNNRNQLNSSSNGQWDSSLIGNSDKQPNTFCPLWMPSERNFQQINNGRINQQLPGNPIHTTPGSGQMRKHTI